MTADQFVDKLRKNIPNTEHRLLSVDDDLPCPRFEIKSTRHKTAAITGYYCESGDGFIQVSFSGREEYTGNEQSSEAFLELLERITQVLSHDGCYEKQWVTVRGEVRRAIIELRFTGNNATYRLGKPPHFWQGGLAAISVCFLPF